jgi:hydroxymethylbilane synthase
VLRLATRGSQLALWQAGHVATLLQAAHPGLEVELVTVTTTGDRRKDVPVWEMGGRGVFVREVQAAVLEGRADAAVHSAKDLQPVAGEGLCLAAVPERADPRDALVGTRLSELGPGAVIATGSQRRRAQLASLRPDLCFWSLRGNIGTRLTRVPPGGAILVAMAALERLGLTPEPMEILSTDIMLPQVAQGALAVECRGDDPGTVALLRAVNQVATERAVEAERAFLATIGGACDLPVAGYATAEPDGTLRLEGLLAALDGSRVVRRQATGAPGEAAALGREVAELVLSGGGRDLLADRQEERP